MRTGGPRRAPDDPCTIDAVDHHGTTAVHSDPADDDIPADHRRVRSASTVVDAGWIRSCTMMHDFAITDRDVVFWDLPVTFDLEAALDFIEDPRRGRFPYAWTPDAGARIGVMPLGGGANRIRWFDIDPCFVFHGSTPSAAGTTSSSTSAG